MLQTSLFDKPIDLKFQETIILALKVGTGLVGGKLRIKELFEKNLSKAEKISLLQEVYCPHGPGGYGNIKYQQRYSPRGMMITLHDFDDIKREYSWSEVYDILHILILSDEY